MERAEELGMELKRLSKEYVDSMRRDNKMRAVCFFFAYQARRKDYVNSLPLGED